MNENRVFDILVIGAGPSGSSAACAASSSGLSVKLIDKRERIGQPVQCGEVISRKCLDHSGLDEDGDWIVGRIKGYRIISPSGDSLVSDSDGFSIYRELFDKALVDRAISSGVKFSSKTDAISAIRKKDLWEATTSKGTVRSRAVILAAGPTSRLNSMFG
ncbi:MAG: NAD(P)/FAD-dependent oxidoreductase, partial [Candidatus Thermoplasmatota archaeon]|nr:NAD(P)/FAD-dependent oxidoreductase [Candidatus Thermoplasmatota archaeon]